MGKNLPGNEGGPVGSLMGKDPICHVATKSSGPQLLSLDAPEPTRSSKKGRCSEKLTQGEEEQPPVAATGESPHAATETQRGKTLIIQNTSDANLKL